MQASRGKNHRWNTGTWRLAYDTILLRAVKNCGLYSLVGLAVPRSQTTTYGQRSLSVSGPLLWNPLPLFVRDPSLTMTQFCTHQDFSVSPSILYLA